MLGYNSLEYNNEMKLYMKLVEIELKRPATEMHVIVTNQNRNKTKEETSSADQRYVTARSVKQRNETLSTELLETELAVGTSIRN